MLKYRMYVLAVFYIAVILVVFSLVNSRGCYLHPNTDMSMPLINPEQFYYIGKKFNTVESLKRGDIVLYYDPADPDTFHPIRVIGLPGETVEIRDKTFVINGEKTDCSFGNITDPRNRNKSVLPRITIPRNILYVLPDNREHIDFSDQKYFIHIYQVKGKMLGSIFKDESY